jgi:hypothetical protein
MSSPAPNRPVRRRHVFYIPGYDPMPAARLSGTVSARGRAAGASSGHEIHVAPAGSEGGYAWHVTARIEGQPVEATDRGAALGRYRAGLHGRGNPCGIPGQLLRTAWIYLSSGALFRLMRLRKGPVIAALFPVVMLLGQWWRWRSALGLAAFALRRWGLGAGGSRGARQWPWRAVRPWAARWAAGVVSAARSAACLVPDA